jgi:GGDEF domain-containing protein
VTAEAIRGSIRESDIVGRDGGRFYVLLPECPETAVSTVWERIRANLERVELRWGDESHPLKWHAAAVTMYGVHAQLSRMRQLAEEGLELARKEKKLVVLDKNGAPVAV